MSILSFFAVFAVGLIIGYFVGYWFAAMDSKGGK